MVKMNGRKFEHQQAILIAKRANKMVKEMDFDYPVLEAEMDVIATHLNGCPLKLTELAKAPDFDFAHDVFGIRRNLDRTSGQLGNCFLPRYSA